MPYPAIGQYDIRIKNLPRQGVYTARANRGSHVVVQPANKVVANIFWILVHVRPGCLVLVIDLDRIGKAYLLKCLVPGQHAFPNPATITNRRGVFDVEDNRVLGRTHLEIRITFFQVPTIDIPNPCVLIGVFSQVTVGCGEIPDPFVSSPRLVGRLDGNITNRVVQRLKRAPAGCNFKCQFNITGKCLYRGNRLHGT